MDIKIYYQQKGSGFPLILLHGNGESSDYFRAQMDYFYSFYQVIAPDTRGHGQTPRGTAAFSLSQFADDLYDFLLSLGIAKIDLVGFSDGGNIGLIFSLRYPHMVRKLVLNGANLFPHGMKFTVWLSTWAEYLGVSLLSLLLPGWGSRREMLALMTLEPRIKLADLAGIDFPVLVIVGTEDMIRDKHSRSMANAIPNSEFARIKGSHFIAMEQSEEFNRIVGEFLGVRNACHR